MSYTLHLGDCLEVMPTIEAGSIDAIIADWPYGTTACKWDSVIPLEPLWKECKRVIKPGGAVVLTASQPFTSVLVMSNLKWFKYELVWDKVLGGSPLNAPYQPLKTHESVLVFCSSASTYSPNGVMVYNPQMVTGLPYFKKNRKGTAKRIFRTPIKTGPSVNKTGQRYPKSIIQVSNASRNKLHPTQKPVALMEYLIKTYTNPGDLVLDNTFGSCSTGEACLRTGRRFVGIEMDPGYFEIAQSRLERVEQELREAQIAKKRQPYLMGEAAL